MTALGNLPREIRQRARQVRLLVLDVDGVLTDGQLIYDAQGQESKAFHVRDGYGIKQVMKAGVTVAIISGRASAATAIRARELGIEHVYLGRDDKDVALAELLESLGASTRDMACMGDDSPDLAMMRVAGLAVAVADAHPSALDAAHWVTQLPGGRGAVREFCDLLVDSRQTGTEAS